jgi:hypothetical protein
MPAARVIFQAPDKISALCAVLHRTGVLPRPDMKALAGAAGIPYSTLKSSVQQRRFSSTVEDALAAIGRFSREHHSWVDETVSAATRRGTSPDRYPGRDTIAHFRARLNSIWHAGAVTFRSSRRGSGTIDPHLARHELSDLGQSTAEGSGMQLFLTANFEPFHHRSGLAFGFRKVAITMDIECGNGARAVDRLGYPDSAVVRDATVTGDGMSRQLCWAIERRDDPYGMLHGEYSSEDPLVTIENYDDGTGVTSRLEANIFDRKTCCAEGELDISANKQALIEQIFWKELPEAEARNGWVVLSREESVIARYER